MKQTKAKIVYIISTLAKTGPVNVLYNIIKYLDKQKFNITIITLSPEKNENSLWNDFEKMGVHLISLNLSRVQGYLLGGLNLKKEIDKIKPDIIHTHCFRSNLLSALFLNGYNRCSTVHCDYKIDFQQAYGKLGFLMFILNHFALFLIKNNICCSEALANLLNKKYPYMKFSFVNNGIDTEIFHPVKDKNDLREKLNLPKDKKIFIWVGNMIKRKNPFLLVDAILNDNTKDNFYVFCGDGPLLEECKTRLTNNKNVFFTGRVDVVLSYLQASDYFISTSLSEGLPMAVLEAGACGLPCLLSDISQHRFLFDYNQQIGKIFDLNNEKTLQTAIKEIKLDDYQQLSKNIEVLVITNFNAKSMAKNYEDKYENYL